MPYTVILTAANPKGDLTFLKKEFQDINTHFSRVPAEVVHREINLNATEEAIFNAYLSNTDIRLFHYSGHAGEGSLLMDDGQLSGGNILAAMMRDARHLNLVFLNGCATYELVDKFLEYGAKLVIATSAPVYDSVAAEFSSNFYQALCVQGLSVGVAFGIAKNQFRKDVESILKEVKETRYQGEYTEVYEEVLKRFAKSNTARTILKKENVGKKDFEWGMYFNENATTLQKKGYEDWELVDNTPVKQFDYNEPSFRFLKQLAKRVEELRNDILKKELLIDPHLPVFENIVKSSSQSSYWNIEQTKKLITELQDTLFLPLKIPYDKLINHSKSRLAQIQQLKHQDTFDLLVYQINLYKAFMRTGVIIMLSDLMESTVKVGLCQDQQLKNVFVEGMTDNDNKLPVLFKQLIDGTENLDNIEFAIKIMRNVVTFLKNAQGRTVKDKKIVFEQFVPEYNGNSSGSCIDMALTDSVHELMITVLQQFENKDFSQKKPDQIRSYCDRIESALIKLFEDHKYVLLYEIFTVGKVEASRRRDTLSKIMYHEVFTFDGDIPPLQCEYKDEFTENYSVLLVRHRTNFLKYLSLSPFIINVCPFFEVDAPQPILFFFKGRAGDYLEYVYYDYEAKSYCDDEAKSNDTEILKIHTKSSYGVIDNPEDNTFLILCPLVESIYNRRNSKLNLRIRNRFAKIRDQFLMFEEQFFKLIKT